MKLKDKSALITGAASGIGKDIALLFARDGAKVAVADLDRNAADVTAAQIRARGQAIGIAMDVPDENTVGNGVAAVIDAFSSVDILIAGIQIVDPIEEFTYSEWDAGDPSRRRVPDDSRVPSLHVQGRARRQPSSIWDRCIPRKLRCSMHPTSPPSMD